MCATRTRTSSDIGEREQANLLEAADVPLLRLAIRLTAVVHKARVVAFRAGIDDQVFVERQEVKVAVVVRRLLLQSALTFFFVDQLADVLNHKRSLFNILQPRDGRR